jgi:transposase InsO family protein
LETTLAYFASLGISVARVMTDNGCCHHAFAFRDACRRHGLKHIRTRPYTKNQRQGRALYPDALREWASAEAYPTPNHRAAVLPHRHTWHRPHGSSLNPSRRSVGLDLTEDNLLRLHR